MVKISHIVVSIIIGSIGMAMIVFTYIATPSNSEINEYRQSYDIPMSYDKAHDLILQDNPQYLNTFQAMLFLFPGIFIVFFALYIWSTVFPSKPEEPRPQPIEQKPKIIPPRPGMD